MSPVFLLFLLFIFVPLAEVGVFIQVGGLLGLWPTLALCLVTAAIGTLCIRYQGFNLVTRARAQLDSGEAPVFEVVSGVCLVIAGVLLLVPGFVTDAVGFLLLFPPARRLFYDKVLAPRITRMAEAQAGRGPGRPGGSPEGSTGGSPDGGRGARPGPPPRPSVIEGEFEEVGESKGEMPPPRGSWDKSS